MNFIEKCIAGEAKPDQIDDYIEMWHLSQDGVGVDLHEYLGFSWDEYSRWAMKPSLIHEIIKNRRNV